jgi:N utilization substance protein A
VEVRAIAREPGARAKVAVMATQPGVDPVGACVGIKGVRIQAIVRELHDEKIDIIQWDQDPVIYISKAISPARVNGVFLTDGDGSRTATVVVMEDQLSLAIGRDGQNARLAAKLTGWRIDIKSVVEAAGDALNKLQSDPELAAALPAAVETIPQVQEVLAKKAENRPVTPEEYSLIAQFVERVERRTIQIKEAAIRADEEKQAAARAQVPPVAFTMPLQALGLKEHIFNILTEGGYETIGDLMFALTLDENKVLGLAGVGPKAIESMREKMDATEFPEIPPEAAAPEATEVTGGLEAPPVEVEPVTAAEAAAVSPEAVPLAELSERGRGLAARAKELDQDVEAENAKDGVSLDELFKMKPEIFRTTTPEEDEAEKKKAKKQKSKGVELVLDEELGAVVGRKKHKRGDDLAADE